MNSYLINCSSQTVSGLSTLFIATALLVTVQVPLTDKEDFSTIKGSVYSSSAIPATFDQYSNIYSGEFIPDLDPFVEVMSDLYASLIANQERLEPEFELVLNENIWDLYES
jgi:hypothetical protein